MTLDLKSLPECVLSRVFKLCSLKERLAFRLVDKQWNRIVVDSAEPLWVDILIHNEDQDQATRTFPVVDYRNLGRNFICKQQNVSSNVKCNHVECCRAVKVKPEYVHLCYLEDFNRIQYPMNVRNLKLANLDQNELYSSQILILQELLKENKAFRKMKSVKIGLVKVSGRIFRSLLTSLPRSLTELEIDSCNLSESILGEIVSELRKKPDFQILSLANSLLEANNDNLLLGVVEHFRSGVKFGLRNCNFEVSTALFRQFLDTWRSTPNAVILRDVTFLVDPELRAALLNSDGIEIQHATNPYVSIITRHLPSIDNMTVLATKVRCQQSIPGLKISNDTGNWLEAKISYSGPHSLMCYTSEACAFPCHFYPPRFELTKENPSQIVKLVVYMDVNEFNLHTKFFFVEMTPEVKNHFSWGWFDSAKFSFNRKHVGFYHQMTLANVFPDDNGQDPYERFAALEGLFDRNPNDQDS
ncbi:hypothetical protein L596_010210 [Steinernema carpocapsae]|uniref:F-box domain-containing protein n=1 Tax=Steinernema carpocapsae TaxID=34508 RepID=A0A4U5PHN6_STECR|nr:hypothetical protein L596_010210 [Steinernema carpocapsae]